MKKFLLITVLVLTLGFSFAPTPVFCNTDDGDDSESITLDTAACLFLLDGEKVPASIVFPQIGNTVEVTALCATPQEAIFLYGEKARYGIVLFESTKIDSVNVK